MLNVYTIKTKDKIYISDEPGGHYYQHHLSNYFFNGEKAKPSFHKNWLYVTEDIKEVTTLVKEHNLPEKYELIDKSLICEKIPEFLDISKVCDEDGDWLESYNHLKSLYKMKCAVIPEKHTNVEFSIIPLMEVKNFEEPDDVQIKFKRKHKIAHSILDEIMYPSLILKDRPCKLTSQESYEIIRKFIKENIDCRVSKITSDYDFCFTVKKIIKLAKPYYYNVDVSIGRQRPKYETRLSEEKYVQIFEMTHKDKNYKGYTPIQEFAGKNEKDLMKNIDNYCKELIAVINEPIKECEHCNGTGHLFNGEFK
jgi:hypothetical protein